MVGEQIQQYRILREIGRGAMGVVYEAVHASISERHVALKLLDEGLAGRPDLERRFLDEANALASLNHPNVAILYDFFVWQGKPVSVMEFIDGESLGDLMERRTLSVPEAVGFCKQALCGVDAAHRKGIVHRDLKPGNLMCNGDGVVKVIDFGVARMKSGAHLTQMGGVLGTYAYMSPEQVQGQLVDKRSDIYAMGIVLYEMLTGDVPFTGTTEYSIQRAHVELPPPPPSVRNPRIPKSLENILLRALAKAPGDRFSTAEEFRKALESFDRETVDQPGPGTLPPGPNLSGVRKTRRLGPIASVLGGVVLIVGTAVAWNLAKPNTSNPPSKGTSGPANTDVVTEQEKARKEEEARRLEDARRQQEAKRLAEVKKNQQEAKRQEEEKRQQDAKREEEERRQQEAGKIVLARGFSGDWDGNYFEKGTSEVTQVKFHLNESEQNKITGKVHFIAANASGDCPVSGKDSQESKHQLELDILCDHRMTHPGVFDLPVTFKDVSPDTTTLSRDYLANATTVTAKLEKERKR